MSNRVKNFRLIILFIICFLFGYYFGITKISYDWKNYKPQILISSKEPPSGITNVDFAPFWIVWQKLQTITMINQSLMHKKWLMVQLAA